MRGVLALFLLCTLGAWRGVAGKSPHRTNKDWSAMTDKDWERIEEEWETPEEKEEYAFKPPQQKGVDMDKLMKAKGKKRANILAESQQSSGPTMMFATLDYPGCCDKKKTEEIGTRWAGMLRTSGMDISTYVIEDDQVLFSSQNGMHAHEIRDYVTQQTECVAVDWNQQRFPGPAETPEWKAKDAVKKAEKGAEKAKREAEQAALKKAEVKRKKKKKQKKKQPDGATKEDL